MSKFPELDIPDFYKLSKESWWNPKVYSPMVFNEKIMNMAEKLKPGTIEYDDFWDEMDYYCINGFKPKGKMPRISGRYFFYLNFCKIKLLPKGGKMKVMRNPLYRDLDHWLFLEIEAAEKYGYGLIIAKPRQVGLSEIGSGCGAYNLRFYKGSEIAVATGHSDKFKEFKQKLESTIANIHPAYQVREDTNNEHLLEYQYYDVVNKTRKVGGIQTKARFKTMYANSGAFEGINNCKLAIFEEAGLFENLTMSFKATAPAFRSGALQYGLPMVYGTGGELDSGAKGYDEMWREHEAYNLKPLFVSATHFFPGKGKDKDGKEIDFFDYDKGVTNREAAKEYILEDRKIASRTSKDVYIKHLQTYPLSPSEVFIKTKGGVLDLVRLNFQLKEIREGNSFEPVLRGRLDWVDSPETSKLLQRAKNLKEKTKIRIANGSKVKFVVDEEGPMYKQGNPINQNITHLNYKPDIGGCDSYDEQANEQNGPLSAGAIVAYRCFSGPTREFNYPVGVLCQRGDASFDDDEFYENAVKFAVYWDIEVLIEYSKILLFRYFHDVGAEKYLKNKPELEGGVTSNHRNTYGLKVQGLIPLLTKLLKLEIKENISKYFIESVVLDLMKFGEENTDISMALAMCLAHRMDIFEEITEDIEVDRGSYFHNNLTDAGSGYYIDIDGNLRSSMTGIENEVEAFIPERDLSSYEYKTYMDNRQRKKEEQEKREKDYIQRSKEAGIDKSILDLIIKEKQEWENREQ